MSLLTDIIFNIFCNQKSNNAEKDNVLKNAPTAESVEIVINFNYWNLLLFLFPNNFKNSGEAYNFYKNFCEKVKSAREDEEIYKLPEKIRLICKVDMNSGLVVIWNSLTKGPERHFNFYLLSHEKIKNEVLKNEILQLYENNYEHLNKLGIVDKFTNGSIMVFNHFVITSCGLFKNTYWAPDYSEDNCIWEKETKDFFLPTDFIIDFFRKIKTNQHLLSEDEILKFVQDVEKKYSDYDCKIDIKNFEAQLKGNILDVYIKTKYYYPAEDITLLFDEPKLPYKTIDLDLF